MKRIITAIMAIAMVILALANLSGCVVNEANAAATNASATDLTSATDSIMPSIDVEAITLAAAEVEAEAERFAAEAARKAELAEFVSTADAPAVQNYIDAVGNDFGAVGIQVAVINNGDPEMAHTYNYGWAISGSVKMGSENEFRVASLSKSAVAINAMKMQEDGIVDVDAPISNYWGGNTAKTVTLRNLLSHTSTLSSGCSYKKTREGTLAQLQNPGCYTGGTPGTRGVWGYNNYAVGVAGSTLEVAANRLLTDYAKENVFGPLGMDAAFASGEVEHLDRVGCHYYHGGGVSRSAGFSRGYTCRSTPGANTNAFAGGLTCSAQDYAKLYAMLACDGTYNGAQVLTPESVAVIEERLFTASEHGGTFDQCMPLRYKEGYLGVDKVYYHTGNAYGVLALASYNPDTKDVVVVVTTGASDTRDAQGVYAVGSRISEYLYTNVLAG